MGIEVGEGCRDGLLPSSRRYWPYTTSADTNDTFLKSGERGLKARSGDEADTRDREVKELHAKVGELVLELDARKKLQALNDRESGAF